MADSAPPTLDPAQEVRIEAVHGGFLYQHLYAVGCLLAAARLNATQVVIERDEDIEVETGQGRTYIQVKKRNRPIIRSDIQSAFNRFEVLREEHRQGRRAGAATFAIVVNQLLGPELASDVASGAISPDVEVMWPGRPPNSVFAGFPPAWSSIDDALAWCVQAASTVPLAMLAPDSLVWKLAGRVLSAAAGTAPHADHAFAASDLPFLFEQLLVQLQDFPSPPLQYRPQADEPEIDSGARVRIISGFSGAGKTSWASQAATYSRHNCAYYDCAETPGEAIAPSLVRELAAKLVGASPEAVRRILMPGATGIESFRALDVHLGQIGLTSTVVLDNVHRVPAESIQRLVNASVHLRMVLLSQPVGSLPEIEALLGIKREALNGWSVDEVAAASASWGCRGDATAMGRLRSVTGGMPLFVQSAAAIAREEYQGSVPELCNALEALTNTAETAQETILAKVFSALPEPVQRCVAVLGLSDIGLEHQEVQGWLQRALGVTEQAVAAALRTLRSWGVVEVFGAKQVKLHDAIRLLGGQHLATLPPETRKASLTGLKELLLLSLYRERDTSRFSLLTRVLLAADDVKILVDLIGEEMFHEMGVATEMWHHLEELVSREGIDAEQHYWALDGLVFSDIKRGRYELLPPRFAKMQHLIDEGGLGNDALVSFTMKRMFYDAYLKDTKGVTAAIAKLRRLVPENDVHQRVYLYNAAASMLELGQLEQALALASDVVDANFRALGITAKQVHLQQAPAIRQMINWSVIDHADVKRLADALDLKAKVSKALHLIDPFLLIQAMKFYGIAGAVDSVVRVGQDLADEFVSRHDFVGAREVLEQHVIPVVTGNKLLTKNIGARGQYAVVLAYCGDYAAAEREMARLQPYVDGLDDRERTELQSQIDLIGRIKRRPIPQRRFGMPLPVVKAMPIRSRQVEKVGRNDPCPCGSGKKLKKCGCGLTA